jgi:signal transduction histidine kinase/ActR/RegA family two-component response regulator
LATTAPLTRTLRRPGFRTGVIVATGAALVAVVAYLLFANYRSALAVRGHLVAERTQQVRARAASLGFFFSSAAEDLRYLAESREVSAFHENRSLGMSMQYGLALSLVPIRERLMGLVEGAQDGPPPKFFRVAVIDVDGTVLAEAAVPGAPRWSGHLDEDGARAALRISADGRQLTLVRPYRFKGQEAGVLAAWLRPEPVLATMDGGVPHTPGARLRLEDDAGRAYRPDAHPELEPDASTDAPSPAVVVRAGVPEQALWLSKVEPNPSVAGELSPETSALHLALATGAVLVVLVLAIFLNTKALVLETRLEESLRRERAVAEKHAALEQETAERQRLEEQLRHAQKLEAVGTLAGGVAHDFNNLLTAIQMNASFALESLGEADPVRTDVAEIQKAARRAVELTKQLLAFSRKQVLKPEVLDVNAVLAGIEKMLRSLLGEQIELVLALGDDLRRVRVDPGQLEQVILNLAVNARDAMPDGGRLSFSTADVDVSEMAARGAHGVPGPCVRLTVSDEGQGMSPEVLAHIFEPFFTTKAQGKGTGLGLATVYGIVSQSRGFIQVRSTPRGGTTFDIYLPAAESPALTPMPMPALPSGRVRSGRGETVLVAEDERQVRDAVQRQLATEGYRVLVAADGREALDLAEAHGESIDVLLSDVVMPRLSGPDLARRFREHHPEAVVIFMSGYSEEAVVRQGDLGDRSAFVQKPYSVPDLACTIRRLLDAGSVPGREEHHAFAG